MNNGAAKVPANIPIQTETGLRLSAVSNYTEFTSLVALEILKRYKELLLTNILYCY